MELHWKADGGRLQRRGPRIETFPASRESNRRFSPLLLLHHAWEFCLVWLRADGLGWTLQQRHDPDMPHNEVCTRVHEAQTKAHYDSFHGVALLNVTIKQTAFQ